MVDTGIHGLNGSQSELNSCIIPITDFLGELQSPAFPAQSILHCDRGPYPTSILPFIVTSSVPSNRITRRRSSAGPLAPQSPSRLQARPPLIRTSAPTPGTTNTTRTPFLTLNDHGKVYVGDLPKLSDGQLANLYREANEVFASLEQRIAQLESDLERSPRDAVIRASTKRDITLRFIKAIDDEQKHRRSNPNLRAAASESLSRAFMEVSRHRLPGSDFDSFLQEALALCQKKDQQHELASTEALPVIVSAAPSSTTSSQPDAVQPDITQPGKT